MSDIKDINLFKSGQDKMDWAFSHMPVLSGIKERFEKEKPLKGLDVSLSIHLEAKTANLATTIRAGGANVYVTGSNPLSTQDDIAAALVKNGFEVNAIYGANNACGAGRGSPRRVARGILHPGRGSAAKRWAASFSSHEDPQ